MKKGTKVRAVGEDRIGTVVEERTETGKIGVDWGDGQISYEFPNDLDDEFEQTAAV